jgi:glycosyltransferase involved in cell wall biosynthesis
MKVVFITNHFPPVVDGVADHTYQLARKFIEDGHEVAVICSYHQKHKSKQYDGGIKLYPIVRNWNLYGVKKALDVLKRYAPDHIILQYVPYGFHLLGMPFMLIYLALSIKYNKQKLSVFFHEYASGIGFHGHWKFFPVSLAQFFIAYCLKKLSFLSIYTLDVLDEQFASVPNKLKLYIGSNISAEESLEEVQAIRDMYAPKGEYLLCTFGMKEQGYLLDTLHELKRRNAKFKLFIIGKLSSQHLNKICSEAQALGIWDNIHITGYLENTQVYHHLKASDLYLSFNKVDAKGRGGISTKSGAIAAAFMAGLPVVGTKGHMTGVVFQSGENVLLIRPEKIKENTEKILHLLHNQEIRLCIGKNAWLTYRHHMSWEVNYRKLIKTLC